MEKLKGILAKIFICGLALMFLVPVFSVKTLGNVSLAEEESVKYSLLPPTYNSTPSQTESKYNISTSQTSSFTPFDFDNKQRMSGMSFTLPVDDRGQINSEYIYVDEVQNLSNGTMYSLFVWIYFDNVNLHNLTLTLEFSNGAEALWFLSMSQLRSLLSKYEGIEMSLLPYGWNRLELPLFLAEVSGDITDGENYLTIERFIVDFSSDLADEFTVDIARLRFYDIYLAESTLHEMVSVEKQPYRFYSFNFIDAELASSFCVGDSYTLPSFSKAVEYAWNGDLSLTSSTNPTIAWRVVVKTPDSENDTITTNFGETITFSKEGTYQIYYQCVDISNSQDSSSSDIGASNQVILSGSQTINVRTLNAVYFNKSSLNIEVGKTYVIKVSSSSVFTEVSDFTFSASDNLEVVYTGNGYVEITATEEGEYELRASVEGSRLASPEKKTYTSSLSITASVPTENDNLVLKIVLWSVLGVFVVVLVGLGIKMLVKVNKYDVK